MTLAEAVSTRVKALLAEKNYSQYQLEKRGGIPRSTVSVLIACKHKTVNLDTIYQIAATLGISLQEFFDDSIFSEVTD